MSIWKWSQWLDPIDPGHRISLGEGHTPLVRSRWIGPRHGLNDLWFKLESANPSGSYKDRFAAAAISRMAADGRSHCLATSSGNTGAALAAYCAAAGMDCTIAIVETAPAEKLRQMMLHGARLIVVRGFGVDAATTDRVFRLLCAWAERPPFALQISAFRYSPSGMSGVMTLGFELADAVPRHVFVPAGGGGLALAVARGFEILRRHADYRVPTSVHVVQPIGNDTISTPLTTGQPQARSVTCSTQISGLQVANVIDGDATISACRASGGIGVAVSDEQAWQVQADLARHEGIFCEPAAAVSVAGAIDAARQGLVTNDQRAVCILTGTGFKDLAAAQRISDQQPIARIDGDALEATLASGSRPA
ncbi:MAG: pyridoxal-phosphate dependent enzyme [Planctomycetes bacterium]|nr:pyridoxal-phosphate dependent enzyme [Planctomycetota bacterium]